MTASESRLHEKPLRSLLKSISWRVVGSLDTFLIAALWTGGLVVVAGKIAIAEVLTKTVLYFLHERAWSLVDFGTEARLSTRYRRHHPLQRKSTEKIRRSTLKTLTWRVLATLDTILLSWWLAGSVTVAVAIGSSEVITKLFLYYGHERVWARLRIGIEKTPRRRPVGPAG